MTEIILSQVQATEMEFLRRVHGVTLCHKERSYEIRRALNVEFLLRIEKPQLRWLGHVFRMPHERLARQDLLVEPMRKRPRGRPAPGGVTTSPIFLRHALVWIQQKYQRLLEGGCKN